MQIRQATQQDFEACMKVSEDTCYSMELKGSPKQNCIQSGYLTFFLKKEDAKQEFMRMVNENAILFLEQEENVIAFAILTKQDKVYKILDFVVTRQKQLQGLGTYFANVIIKEAKALRMKKIWLYCEFKGSMEFWKKVGFEEKARGKFEKIL